MPSHQDRRDPLPKDYQFGDMGETCCAFRLDPADKRTRCILVKHDDAEHACPDWPGRLINLHPADTLDPPGYGHAV